MSGQARARLREEGVAERIGVTTSRLHALLRHHFAQAEIPTAQARTLATLATRGPQRLTVLALIEQVAQPSMSVLVGRLEAHGLVKRVVDPVDGKTNLITITEPGLEVWHSFSALRTKFLAAGVTRLSDTETATLERALPALERLVEVLDQAEAPKHARV